MRLGRKGCWRIGRSIAKLWLALLLLAIPVLIVGVMVMGSRRT